jgi:hypothetical protein
MSNDVMRTHLVYQGPFGLVVYEAASFFASKDGFPIGTYARGSYGDTRLEGKAQRFWRCADHILTGIKEGEILARPKERRIRVNSAGPIVPRLHYQGKT